MSESKGADTGEGGMNPVIFSRDSDVEAAFRESEMSTITKTTKDDGSVEAKPSTTPEKSKPIVATDTTPPPSPAAQSIITQTDQHGTPKKVDQAQAATAALTVEHRKLPWYHCLLRCCFGRDNSDNDSRSSQMTHTNRAAKASSSRNSDRYRIVRLLGPQSPEHVGRKCLVLDLDETLVHSSFQAVPNPDYIIPVNIDNVIHNVYVLKRPGVDEFMRRMAEVYEVVIFTASLSKYADPLLDELDPGKVISKRLFRESCVLHEGHYVKDLSLLNRDVSQCIIVDNSQMSYSFHPENAIDCFSYIDDPKDVELWEIADFLESIKGVKDVRYFCRTWKEWCRNNAHSSAPKR